MYNTFLQIVWTPTLTVTCGLLGGSVTTILLTCFLTVPDPVTSAVSTIATPKMPKMHCLTRKQCNTNTVFCFLTIVVPAQVDTDKKAR